MTGRLQFFLMDIIFFLMSEYLFQCLRGQREAKISNFPIVKNVSNCSDNIVCVSASTVFNTIYRPKFESSIIYKLGACRIEETTTPNYKIDCSSRQLRSSKINPLFTVNYIVRVTRDNVTHCLHKLDCSKAYTKPIPLI